MTHSIRITYDAGTDPVSCEPIGADEEVVSVAATSLLEARSRALAASSVRARGRLVRVYDAESGVEVGTTALAELRPAQFQIDGLDGVFDGYTRGETWNGWAVPYFPLAEARRIAGRYASQPATEDGQAAAAFDEARAVVRLYDPVQDEWDEVSPVDIDGHTLYSVGAHLWTWEHART